MTAVVFICTANQCRSPMAERLLRARLHDADLEVSSAGLAAVAGAPMVAESAEALRERGGDPRGFASRPADAATLAGADLVLTMTTTHREELIGRFPRLMRRTFTVAEAARLAAGIDTGDRVGSPAEALAAARARRAGTPAEDDEVPDPVGHPIEAHRRVAAQLDGYLDVLLPLLRGVPPAR